jgi:hypothetical protein
MSSGEIKVNRIKSRHQSELALLGDTLKLAQEHIPKLRTTAQNRVIARNIADTFSALGRFTRVNGFDPTRTFQHVANFDSETWTLILDMFARYDEETGELMDDGLLYKTDPNSGVLKLNKDFFYALVEYFESAGITCDMRGKIKLT